MATIVERASTILSEEMAAGALANIAEAGASGRVTANAHWFDIQPTCHL